MIPFMEEPACTIQPTTAILLALRQSFLLLNLVLWLLLGWSFSLLLSIFSDSNVGFGCCYAFVFVFFFFFNLFELIAGDLLGL